MSDERFQNLLRRRKGRDDSPGESFSFVGVERGNRTGAGAAPSGKWSGGLSRVGAGLVPMASGASKMKI